MLGTTNPTVRRVPAIGSAMVVLALLVPATSHAQADLEVTLDSVTGNFGPGGSVTYNFRVTNLGPAPDPEVNISSYFLPYLVYTPVEPCEFPPPGRDVVDCLNWSCAASQGVCFFYADTNDDLVAWNDYYSIQAELGAMLPDTSATLSYTVPIRTTTPPEIYKYQPYPGGSVWWVDSRVKVTSPPEIAGEYVNHAAMFGAQWDGTWQVTGDLELVYAPGSGSLGCGALEGFTPGNIAMVDRGQCYFDEKTMNAQDAGAVAAIIVNNDPDQDILNFTMAPHDLGEQVTLPVTMISTADGDTIKPYVPGGASATLWTPLAGDCWDLITDSGTFAETNDPDLGNNFLDGLLQVGPCFVFADGFETGDTSVWSATEY